MKRIHVFTFHQWYLILNPWIDYLDLNWWIVPALGPMYQYQHVSIKWYICINVVVIRLSLSLALFQISGGPWIFLCDIVINKWTVPSCCTDRCCWSSRINHRWEFSHCRWAETGRLLWNGSCWLFYLQMHHLMWITWSDPWWSLLSLLWNVCSRRTVNKAALSFPNGSFVQQMMLHWLSSVGVQGAGSGHPGPDGGSGVCVRFNVSLPAAAQIPRGDLRIPLTS